MATNTAFKRTSNLMLSLACSSAITILVGAIGVAEQPDVEDLIGMGWFLVMVIPWLICIEYALATAAEHPRLKLYMPGCYVAAFLAAALWSVFFTCVDPKRAALAWETFLLFVSVYAAVLLELAAGVFLRATVWLQAGSEDRDN